MKYHVSPGGRGAVNVSQGANVQSPHLWIGRIDVPPWVVSLLEFVLSALSWKLVSCSRDLKGKAVLFLLQIYLKHV